MSNAAGDVGSRFQSLVNAVLDEFRAYGRPDLVREVAAEAERPRSPRPVVVVAGETKRGKSSIVNALIGRPGLSPTGPDLATSAYLVFSHGDGVAATVSQLVDGEVVRREIPVEDLAEWGTSDGNPGNVKQVVGIEVTVPAPLLETLTLVDTPGAGGLDSPQGALSLPAVRQADAVVFVLDAGTPISAAELAFLYEASARVEAVIVAVGKADDFRGREQVVADDRALLTRYAPARSRAPLLAVAATVAEVAARQAPGELAEELRQESGLPELERVLRERVVVRAGVLRACNILLAARDGLRQVGELATAALAASQGDPGLRALLDDERARLAGFQRETSDWHHKLANGVNLIKIAHSRDLSRGIGALQRSYGDRAEHAKRGEDDAIADALIAEAGALAASLSEQAGFGLADLVIELMGEVEGDDRLAGALARASASALGDGAMRIEMPEGRDLTKVDKLSTLVSFSSGKSIGGIATSLPVVAGFGLPVVGVGLGAGALFSVLMTRGRQDLNRQANLKSWAGAQLADAQTQIASDFAERMVHVQEELRQTLVDYLDRRRRELDDAVRGHDRALAEERSSGGDARKQAESKVARVRGLMRGVDELLAAFGGMRRPAGELAAASEGSA